MRDKTFSLSSSFWKCCLWCLCVCSSKGRLVRRVWDTTGTGLHRNSLHTAGLHVDTSSWSLTVLCYPIPIPPRVHQNHLQYWMDVSIVHSICFNLQILSPDTGKHWCRHWFGEELFRNKKNLGLLTCQTETLSLADTNLTEFNKKTGIC